MAPTSLQHHLDRIRQQIALAGRRDDPRSSATKGSTREDVLLRYLKQALPGSIRISSGDVVDSLGSQSGQLEIILESAFAPSVPELGDEESKLHLAEGVIAVIEIKSDISTQWNEVAATAAKVRALRRTWNNATFAHGTDPHAIPVYAIGYRGWTTIEHARRHVDDGTIDGALVLESDIHVSRFMTTMGNGTGLLGMLWALHFESQALKSMSANIVDYFKEHPKHDS